MTRFLSWKRDSVFVMKRMNIGQMRNDTVLCEDTKTVIFPFPVVCLFTHIQRKVRRNIDKVVAMGRVSHPSSSNVRKVNAFANFNSEAAKLEN